MQALPEYNMLQEIVKAFGRRYLRHAGVPAKLANNVGLSVFSWAALHTTGGFHGPHIHIGEYYSAVFYAKVGPGAGALRFADPRGGHGSPFGKEFVFQPKSGDLILFPSHAQHMALVTANASDGNERVIFAFNVAHESGVLPS